MGAYGEHSSRLRNFEGFKLVTNLKETKEAKCNLGLRFQNVCCDASLEPSHQHGTNEGSQRTFSLRNKKN